MQKITSSLVSVGLLALSMGVHAQTVYYVDRAIGAGSISGTIETDGTIGALTPANIVSWSLEADDGSGAHPPLLFGSATGGGLTGDGWQFFYATETQLLFDFDGAWDDPGFDDVQFFEEDPGVSSVNYGFAAENTFFGKKEQLVHFFDTPTPGQHIVEAPRTGLTVIATTSGRNPLDSRVVHTISFGGPDVCEAFGWPTGCDANFSGSAVLRADGTGNGKVTDVFNENGIHVDIDCVFVAGNEAWLSGIVTRGATPNGFNLTGFPYIVRVQDNGDSANDPTDGIRARFRPIPCYLAPKEPLFELYEYADGQVTVR